MICTGCGIAAKQVWCLTQSQSPGVCTSSRPQIQTATCFVFSMILRLHKATRMPNNRLGPARQSYLGCLRGVKMKHLSSIEDQNFRREFEACKFPPAEFNHRARIRPAYVYLSAYDTDT